MSVIELDVYEIVAPGDTINFLATLDEAFDKTVRVELNGEGTLAFSINRNDPHATSEILAMGNLVKVRRPAVSSQPETCFFLDSGDFNLISSDEDGGEILHFQGAGGLAYWDRAIWLSETFSLPWWPDCLTGGPTSGATGAVDVKAGRYRLYSISGGNISGYTTVTMSPFCASFDNRRTYQWPAENSKRFLVHLLDGPYAGSRFHPHQDGVTEYLASKSAGYQSGVTLSDVGATPGAVLKYLYDEGTAAGRPVHPIPLMTVDFDDTLDSDGEVWNPSDTLAGLTASVGDYFIETLGQLLGTGVIDMVMGPDLDMHAYDHYGRGLAGSFGAGVVRFEHGVNIEVSLTRQVKDGPVATFVEIAGSEDTFAWADLPDSASRIAREISVKGASTDATTLEAIGQAELQLRLARSDAVSFPIHVGDEETAGFYTPGPPGSNGHFWIGDTVTLHTGSAGFDFDDLQVRVTAITMSEDDDDLVAIVDVRSGPLAFTGSLGINTPSSTGAGDCNCPCDLGTPVPDTDPPAYYGEMYGPSFAGNATGDPDEEFDFMDISGTVPLIWVSGTMLVFVDGVMIPSGSPTSIIGIPVAGEVYAYARVDCPATSGGD